MAEDEKEPNEQNGSAKSAGLRRLIKEPCFVRSQCYGILGAAFVCFGIFGLTGSASKVHRFGSITYLVVASTSYSYCYFNKKIMERNAQELREIIREAHEGRLADPKVS